MPVIKVKLNRIVKMGYKSTYKSEMIQTRLEQGYYDDIVEAGIQGGVFNADTQPTKEELDLKLAQYASDGLPVIFTIPLQDGELENTYDYIADVLLNPQDHPDIVPNGIPDFTIGLIKTSMNSYGEKSGDFFIECSKAQFSRTPIREYKIYPVKLGYGVNTSSYKIAFVVAGDPAYDSYKVVDFYPSLGSVKFPIVETIELNIDDIEPIPIDLPSFASQYLNSSNLKNIASSMKYKPTDVGLIRVKIMVNAEHGVEYSTQGGDAFIKVERWTINGSGSFGGDYFPELEDLEGFYPSVTSTLKLTVFQSGGKFKSFDGYVLVSEIKTENNSFVPTFHTVSFDNNIAYPDLGVIDATEHGRFESIEEFADYLGDPGYLLEMLDSKNTDVGIIHVNMGLSGAIDSPAFKIEKVKYASSGSWPDGIVSQNTALRITSFSNTNIFGFDSGYQIFFPNVEEVHDYQIVYPYPGPDESNKVIYPEIVGYNWSNDGGDSSLTSRDVTIEQVIDKLKDKREEIAGLLEQNEAALVYVKYGSSDLGTEQRPEVYFKVEKTYSRSYLTTGYILRFSVMSPGFENALEPSIAWVFEDGTVKIWKKEDGVTYPHLGTYSSDNGGEENLDELKATFETLTKTLFNKIPENSTGIFDLNVGGIGTLIIKAENVIRQMGTSWERGMYYTIMGGTGGYFDFENYMGLVWVGVGGGTGGNANAVIWRRNNKMIYPQIASFNWGSVSGDGTLLGIWTVDEFASKLSEQYTTILEALSYTIGGVGLVKVTWGEPLDTFNTYVKVESSSSDTYMNSRRAFVATPLVGTNISALACKIYISGKHNYVVIRKEEMVETGLPKIELVIPGNIDTENFTTATAIYPYIKEQFESLKTLMSGKNAVELKVSFEGSSDYWGFFVYKSTSKHSGVSGMETDVYKIEPYTNSFDNNISYEMKYLYMVKSGDELIARVLTYQAGMADL